MCTALTVEKKFKTEASKPKEKKEKEKCIRKAM